jgi:uncharacterized protein
MKKILILILSCFSFFLFAQKKDSVSYERSIEEHRLKYLNDFLADPKAPLQKEDLPFVQFFAADKTYQVLADFVRTQNEIPFEMTTTAGKVKSYLKYGELHFVLNNKKLQLNVYQNTAFLRHPLYKDYLFIPFKDLTTGETTYGAGRYIDTRLSDIVQDKMLIDFNKCYNPYCAYKMGYNCPIPPKENFLEIAILAGEKVFGKEH